MIKQTGLPSPYCPATHRRMINTDEEYAEKLKYYGGHKARCRNCHHDCPQLNCKTLTVLHCPKYPNPTLIEFYTERSRTDNR